MFLKAQILPSILKQYLALVLLCLTFSFSAFSQEEIGYTPSNYSGVQGLFLNPAKGCDAKTFVDVNIIGLDLFVHNNYVHYAAKDFYLWKNISTGFPELVDNTKPGYKRAQVALNVTGPSVHVSIGQHSIGLFTRARSYTSVKLELPLAKHIFEGFKYYPQLRQQYNLNDMFINSLTWVEYGLSYGYIFLQKNRTMMSGGLNIRYLTGINAIGVNIENLNYEVRDSTNLEFYNFSGQVQQAAPAFGSGKGWGLDLGFEYKYMLDDITRYRPNTKRGGCKRVDYKWKLGVSVLDIGYINFNQSASFQDFNNEGSSWYKYDSTGIKGYNGVDSLINARFNSEGNITREPQFKAWMPLAASVQFDYNFENNFYVNATAMYGPRLGNNVRRGGLLAIVPRYERKRWEISLPLSLWDFQYPQFGLQIRLNNMLIIGSDRIMPLIYRSNVYGLDIYFHLKFSLYKNPACKRKGGKKESDCPAYR